MGVAKQKKPSQSLAKRLPWIGVVQSKLSVGLLTGITIVVLLSAGSYLGWKKWGEPVTQQAQYHLSKDNIAITPQPPWIPADVRSEAIRDGSLENLSIFDKELTLRVCRAFEMHPWVAHVNRVNKRPSAKVSIELEYRRPVAWVEVPPGVLPNNEVGLLPVDGQGVLLPPQDFVREQVDDFVRIAVAGLTPCGLPGTAWGDPRVASAARIAAMMAENFQDADIYRILASPHPGDTSALGPPLFEITTRCGARFIWGNAPGHEPPGAPTAIQKSLRLIQLARSAAKAESPEDWLIDLRDPDAGPPAERAAGRQASGGY
ncbi:MAG: hypothetical protein ACC628_00015 [Pirellulaceae bacterium]